MFFKWTCAFCGSRQTFGDANKLYERGICEECQHITNLRTYGCNFLALVEKDGMLAKILYQ